MGKNKTVRAAILLLVLTMITTCFVGGTLAKYVTGKKAESSARVAKWGVNVDIENENMFNTSYTTSYNDDRITVQSSDDANVVAPGTSGKGIFIKVSGTPEVDSKLNFECSGTDIYIGDYHPVEFKLWERKEGTPIVRPIAQGTLEEIMQALSFQSEEYQHNQKIDKCYEISWNWKFESGNDELDTKLGNYAAEGIKSGEDFNTVLKYNINVTAEQID